MKNALKPIRAFRNILYGIKLANSRINNKVRRHILVGVLKGHRILKISNSGFTNKLIKILEDTECTINSKYSKQIFGDACNRAELIMRQFLIAKLVGFQFGRTIFYMYGRGLKTLTYPLPPIWLSVIEKNGVSINYVLSAFLWNLLCLYMLFRGIIDINKFILHSIKAIHKRDQKNLGKFIYFDGLNEDNLPSPNKLNSTPGIISWYQRWSGSIKGLDNICHSVKEHQNYHIDGIPLTFISPQISLPNTVLNLLSYLNWSIKAVLISSIDLLRGRWWHAFMLSEASRMALVRYAKAEVAQDYLFNNSSYLYRPLWTYEVEGRGARVILYFYSTNCESFKNYKMYSKRAYCGYNKMSWPFYLVWDEYQANFIRKMVGKESLIDVVGQIYFNEYIFLLPTLPKNSVAVFDVQPVRDSIYNTFDIEYDYYIPKVANMFLQDIYQVLREHNHTMVLKRKRDISNLLHPYYKNKLEELKSLPNFIEVDSKISAQELILNCNAVISMPFTSTGVIGHLSKKPSVFYDPTYNLYKNDLAGHGIQLVQGSEELRGWLQTSLIVNR